MLSQSQCKDSLEGKRLKLEETTLKIYNYEQICKN